MVSVTNQNHIAVGDCQGHVSFAVRGVETMVGVAARMIHAIVIDSIRLAHGLSLVMYGLNLNNQVFGFYQGSPLYMIQREYYQPTFAAGVRWSPVREK